MSQERSTHILIPHIKTCYKSQCTLLKSRIYYDLLTEKYIFSRFIYSKLWSLMDFREPQMNFHVVQEIWECSWKRKDGGLFEVETTLLTRREIRKPLDIFEMQGVVTRSIRPRSVVLRQRAPSPKQSVRCCGVEVLIHTGCTKQVSTVLTCQDYCRREVLRNDAVTGGWGCTVSGKVCNDEAMQAAIAQSIQRLATSLTVRGSYPPNPSGRAAWGEGLRPIAYWCCGFESRHRHGRLCCRGISDMRTENIKVHNG
jgi:hypothetical protein